MAKHSMDSEELEDILSPFVEESDYVFDPGEEEPVFNPQRCLQRIVAELGRLRDLNKEIACGHSKGDFDLWKGYCTICDLHQQIDDANKRVERAAKLAKDAMIACSVAEETGDKRQNICAIVIPGTFVICGEGDFYCSDYCLNAAKASNEKKL